MRSNHKVVMGRSAWRSAVSMLVLTLIACGAIASLRVVAAPPAVAGCAELDAQQALAGADAVVEGTVVAVQQPRRWFGISTSSDPVTYTVEVERVAAGTVQSRIEVTAPVSYGLGGEASRWLIFLNGDNPRFESNLCLAVPLPIRDEELATTVEAWDWADPEPGGVEMPSDGPPWLGVGIGAGVLVLVLVLVRDARRRHAAKPEATRR